MNNMELEPFAVRLHVSMPKAMTGDAWKRMLAGFMEKLAEKCMETGPCVIGHIKAMALFNGEAFLKISVVDSIHPADVSGNVPMSTEICQLDLNLLVYGIRKTVLSQIVQEVFDSRLKVMG